MTTLQEISDGLAAVVQAVGPSIVRVEGRRWTPGSGLVWSEDGVILTANHVVERDDEIKIGLPGGNDSLAAVLVGRDPATDLAVLRVQSGRLPAVKMASTAPAVGQLVLALGRPGKNVQSSLGVVHAVGGEWQTPAGAQVEVYLQPDLVMYPGFSGGPLVTPAGEVIGLNTSGLLRNTAVTLLEPLLKRVAGELLAHGHIRRGYLGIGSQPVRLPEALGPLLAAYASLLQGQETGLLISSVQPGSPADKAGLMLGDTLVALDNRPLRQMDDLLVYLNGDVVGRSVEATLVRGGTILKVSLLIGEK
jgi:S1-C subfamily serine protease